jgi:hypothetical protein
LITNFKPKDRRDIKIPPIWPTIDYKWDIYITRDYLFQMDKDSIFYTIWNKRYRFSENVRLFL